MTFGERLKFYREQAGMNKSELARKMQVTPAMVRQYEKGEVRSNPKHETIKKFADALGVSLSDLAPDIYPQAFDSGYEFRKEWIKKGGGPSHDRTDSQIRIELNQVKLNDEGMYELAECSDRLVQEEKYKKN